MITPEQLAELRDEIANPVHEIIGLLDTAEALMAAIRKHRADIWGSGPIGHPEDAALYRAAGLEEVVEAEVDDG